MARPLSSVSVSLLPGLLLRTRDALEHVAQLVAAGDRGELSDLLRVDYVVAHAFQDWHHGPRIGHQLDHVVGQCRALGLVDLGPQGARGSYEILARLLAILLVAQKALDALGREG